MVGTIRKLAPHRHGVLTSGKAFATVALECAMNTSEALGHRLIIHLCPISTPFFCSVIAAPFVSKMYGRKNSESTKELISLSMKQSWKQKRKKDG
jgi:hypothetical protein